MPHFSRLDGCRFGSAAILDLERAGPTVVEVPVGKENNWIQKVPGKVWFAVLRLYGPLEPWFAKSWRPGEFEQI